MPGTDPARSDATQAGPPETASEVDVVVVGMGAAGLAAAVTAHDAGASVVVLEKTAPEESGGNTRFSGGAWFDHDDPGALATYLRALCGDRPLPEPVVRVWAEGTRGITAWVESLGIPTAVTGAYTAEYPELPGSDAYGGYRCVDGVLGDSRLFTALEKVVRERGIAIRYRSRAARLHTDGAGAVTGVETEDGATIRARRGVVLATGGFEGDPELVRTHLGLVDPPVWGSVSATGDGLRMAQEVGADLWHMDNMMAVDGVPVPGSRQGLFTMFLYSLGYLWLGDDGRRFVDETAPSGHGQALVDGEYVLKPGRAMHVVFDERTRLAGPISPNADVLNVGRHVLDGYRWSPDNSVEIERGWIVRADTPEELAERLGLPAEAVAESLREYNAACAASEDTRFGRPADSLQPVAEPPFYAYRSGPMLAWTNGGPRRDEHARVLRPDGEPIPGLYAAGTASSTYSWGKDGGFHIADALLFGRVAAEHAVARGA